MAKSREQEFNEDRENRETERGDDVDDFSSSSSSSVPVGSGLPTRTMEEINREDRVLQWLHALDVQVMGACRADERLKPLLKSSTSGGVAEDLFLARLSQHFEPSEVGMLARCFCIPLVSIRVGKTDKQGTLFRPTSTRGNLNLMLLPTSDLRLVFVGDNGDTERLFTVGCKSDCPCVSIDEIPADSSGRSFCIKVADSRDFYFWCSEKSELLGIELLAKMKDLLQKKPSIAELGGIDKSRLDCFAIHFHSYLIGSNARESSMCFFNTSCPFDLTGAATVSSKSRSRHIGNQTNKANSPYQGSLSPRSSLFKEGQPRSLSSLRNAARDKSRRRSDSLLSVVDNLMALHTQAEDASGCIQSENEKFPDVRNCPLEPSCFLESLGKLTVPPILNSTSCEPLLSCPLFSPHYCWCPQGASTSQHPVSTPDPPILSIELPSFPPSLLSAAARSSSLLSPSISLNLSDVPLDFPALFPEPLIRLPISSSQQIPTFTPLICEPIVHIPVIDVCSSGQGYLVSAGPAIQSSISPLLPNLVNPLGPDAESMLEKGARETLRLLISSSTQPKSQLMDVLPAVLPNIGEIPTIIAAGSRGLYTGTEDVDAVAYSIATMGLVSLGGDGGKLCSTPDNLDTLAENLERDGLICLAESLSEHDGQHSNTKGED